VLATWETVISGRRLQSGAADGHRRSRPGALRMMLSSQ
jgi:hypothetical protein